MCIPRGCGIEDFELKVRTICNPVYSGTEAILQRGTPVRANYETSIIMSCHNCRLALVVEMKQNH